MIFIEVIESLLADLGAGSFRVQSQVVGEDIHLVEAFKEDSEDIEWRVRESLDRTQLRQLLRESLLKQGWPLSDILPAELTQMLVPLFEELAVVRAYGGGRLFEAVHRDRWLSLRFVYKGLNLLKQDMLRLGWTLRGHGGTNIQKVEITITKSSDPRELARKVEAAIGKAVRAAIVRLPTRHIGVDVASGADETVVSTCKFPRLSHSAEQPSPLACDWCHQASGTIFSDRVVDYPTGRLHPKCIAFAKAHSERLAAGGVDCPEERASTERFVRERIRVERHQLCRGCGMPMAKDGYPDCDECQAQSLGTAHAPLDQRIRDARSPASPDPVGAWASACAEWP